jgi:hypothetical protein
MKRFVSYQLLNPYTEGRTPWTEISPSQGRYLYRTTQTQNKRKHPCLEWDSNPRSQCSSGRGRFMPYTARPLWSALSRVLSPRHTGSTGSTGRTTEIVRCSAEQNPDQQTYSNCHRQASGITARRRHTPREPETNTDERRGICRAERRSRQRAEC